MLSSANFGILALSTSLFCAATTAADLRPILTAAPNGPYHVSGVRILDAQGRPYLIRGTQMPQLSLNPSDIAGDGTQFGPFSPSSFITLRQRMNMNAIRVPLDADLYLQNAVYRARVKKIAGKANQLELLVILTATSTNDAFWRRCATEFSGNPNLFFAVPEPAQWLINTIRRAGAAQPIIVPTLAIGIQDTNIICGITPHYAATRTETERENQFGHLSETVPLIANGLDPQLDQDSPECAAFPADPTEASRLVEDTLVYFDKHHISWTLSSFVPGKMITEYRFYNWSKLDDGWTCGESPSKSGIAMLLQAHLWSRNPHGLFPVNQTTGSFVLPRGGISTAYGPILAEREMTAYGMPLPTRLGNVAIHVTDSRGSTHVAPLIYTGAGWSELTFVVPASSSLGPAEVAVVRTDGSHSSGKVLIADFAPGFWTASQDGRGAAIGKVLQQFSNGKTKEFQASHCATYGCRPVAIPLSPRVSTTIRLEGSGFRYAGSNPDIRATIGDVRVPVLSVKRGDLVGHDQVTLQLPDVLRGRGEADLIATVNGVLSNVVRINCGAL